MTIGNASIDYVDTQISQLTYKNDGTVIINSKSIDSDGGKFITDGNGNLSIQGSIIIENGEQLKFVDSTGTKYLYIYQDSTTNRLKIYGGNGSTGDIEIDGIAYTNSINSDGGKFTTDGNGNITVGGTSTLTGISTAPTPATSDNSTNIATTAYVQNQGYITSASALEKYLTLTGGTVTGATTFNTDATFDGNIILKGTNGLCFGSDGNAEWLNYDIGSNSITSNNFQVQGAFNNYYSNGQGFEFGTSSSISYIDFHSVANSSNDHSTVNDYDVRLAITNGVSGTSGKGDFSITSNTVGLSNTTVSGYLVVPTPTTTDNSTNAATTEYVQNQGYATLAYLKSIRGIQNADISATGATMTLTIPNENIIITLKNTSSTSASISYAATTGTITPVDIRRVTIWGGSAVETYTLDGGTLTTTPTVVDDTIYTLSNDTSAHFIRVNGNSYVITVWISGNGARSSLIYEKFV